MRTLMIATAVLSLGAASAAEAGTRVVRDGPGMMRPTMPRPVIHAPRPNMGWRNGGHQQMRPRWGGHVQGKWWGGYRAPGGWNAYRRPVRGWVLPSYWIAPSWYINDWSGYGLPQPPQGYNWSRYYDDAVLIDGRGSVYDTIGGVEWDQYDAEGADYSYRDDDAPDGYAQPGAGYAIGRDQDGGRRGLPPPPGHGAGYPPPPGPGYHKDGTTVVTNGGYYANGYYYPGASLTTITVATQPAVTTTTTEIFDDRVTYSRAPVKKVWRKKTWRATPKCVCR